MRDYSRLETTRLHWPGVWTVNRILNIVGLFNCIQSKDCLSIAVITWKEPVYRHDFCVSLVHWNRNWICAKIYLRALEDLLGVVNVECLTFKLSFKTWKQEIIYRQKGKSLYSLKTLFIEVSACYLTHLFSLCQSFWERNTHCDIGDSTLRCFDYCWWSPSLTEVSWEYWTEKRKMLWFFSLEVVLTCCFDSLGRCGSVSLQR